MRIASAAERQKHGDAWDEIAKAIPGPSNFKSKKPAAGFVKGNVVHSSSKGLKNYPHYKLKYLIELDSAQRAHLIKSNQGCFPGDNLDVQS